MAGTSDHRRIERRAGHRLPGRANTTISARSRQLVRLPPSRQLGGGIRAEQEHELRAGLPRAQGAQRVHRVGWRRPLQLGPLHARTPASPATASIEHRRARLGRRGVLAPLERLLPGGHEAQRVQPKLLGRDLSDDEMPMVNRIERPPEEADHPVRRPRSCPADRPVLLPGASGWKRRR